MPRNIGLKLGGAVVTAKPEVVVQSAILHTFTGAAVVQIVVYTICSHLLRSKESATMHTYPPTLLP